MSEPVGSKVLHRVARLTILCVSASLLTGVLVAEASVGAPAAVSDLEVDPTLDPPSNVCGQSRVSAVRLTWDVPSDPAVTGHVVQWRILGTSDWVDGPDVSEPTQVSVPATNGQPLEFRVAAVDGAGKRSRFGTGCLLQWGLTPDGGTPVRRAVPTAITGGALLGEAVVEVGGGYGFACALTASGRVACWGTNEYAQLGDGTTTNRRTPTLVGGVLAGHRAVDIATGHQHACAVRDDGAVACWGRNDYGEVGDGSVEIRRDPVLAAGALTGEEVVSVEAGGAHSCALTDTRRLFCWGYNEWGQVGTGSSADEVTRPVAVNGGALADADVTAIGAGSDNTCAVTSVGDVACWGYNAWGNTGDGTTVTRRRPVLIDTGVLASVRAARVTVSVEQSCAVTRAGGVVCWGRSQTATTSAPPSMVDTAALRGEVEQLASVGNHVCVLTAAGVPGCFGSSGAGELGDGTIDGAWVASARRVDTGGLYRGRASVVGVGDAMSFAVWDGVLAAGEPPLAPTVGTPEFSGRRVSLSWSATAWNGAGALTGYVIQASRNMGEDWADLAVVNAGLSEDVTLDDDGFWSFRVLARNSAGRSSGSKPTAERLVRTQARVVRSNLDVQFATPDGRPIVGAEVSWTTPDGALSGVGTSTTSSAGRAVFEILATGPVEFTLVDGRLAGTDTRLDRAVLTEFVPRSGSPMPVLTAAVADEVARTLRVVMPDGNPVPGAVVTVRGAVAPTAVNTSVSAARSTTSTWRHVDGEDRYLTDGNGAVTVVGLEVPSVGDDVTAVFEDGVLRQRVSGAFVESPTVLTFEQMPVVVITSPAPPVVDPADLVEVVVRAVDGTGAPIAGKVLDLVPVGAGGGATSRAGCDETLRATTGSAGRARFAVCPRSTRRWQVDGTNIVGSKGLRIRVNATPSRPGRPQVQPGSRRVRVTWSAPASDGGPVITDYRVRWSSDGGRSWTVVDGPRSAERTAVVTGLRPGRAHLFAVSARNRLGWSDWSRASRPVTPA